MTSLRLFADWTGTIASNPMLERLCLASLEAAGLALIVAMGIRLTRLRAHRLSCLLWLIVLLKPMVSLTMGTPLPFLRLEASANPLVQPVASAIAVADSSSGFESGSSGLPQMVLALWLTGVVVMVGTHLRSRLWLLRTIRAATAPSESMRARYCHLCAKLRVHRSPRLLVTDRLESPAIVGVVQPTILIPAWLAEETDARQLDWALRHELTHWRCLDPLSMLIRDVAVIVFWFHPVMWWSGRRLIETLELACDQATLDEPKDATDYAEQLFHILQKVRARRRPAVAGGLFATRNQIGKRIAALLDGLPVHSPQLTWKSSIAILAAAGLALSVGIQIGEGNRSQPEARSSTGMAEETGADAGAPTAQDEQVRGFGADDGTTVQPMGFGGYSTTEAQPMGFGGGGMPVTGADQGVQTGRPLGFGGYRSPSSTQEAARRGNLPTAAPALGFGGSSAPPQDQ